MIVRQRKYSTNKNVIWEINSLSANSKYSTISWTICLSLSDRGLQDPLQYYDQAALQCLTT